MNKQQVFERIVDHLLAQKEPALNPGKYACMYRGENGKKCAVGVLIPDEEYLSGFEGKDVRELLNHYPRLHTVFDLSEEYDGELRLLVMLQDIHDASEYRVPLSKPEKFELTNKHFCDRVRRVAERAELVMPTRWGIQS